MITNQRLISALLFLFVAFTLNAKEIEVNSPNKKLQLKVSITDVISYSILKNGSILLQPSQLSMTLYDGIVLGQNPKLKDSKTKTIDETLTPVVKQKFAAIKDNYEELTLSFVGNYSLIFRIYDDGVAYRFKTNFPSEITIKSEQVEYNFDKDYKMLFPEESSFITHYEQNYKFISLSDVTSKRFSLIPVLVELDNDVKAVITEADLEDYCGMYLTGTDKNPNSLVGIFPAYPAKDTVLNDRDVYVAKRENYLAKTSGSRGFLSAH